MHEHAKDASYDDNHNARMQSKGCMSMARMRVTITILMLKCKVCYIEENFHSILGYALTQTLRVHMQQVYAQCTRCLNIYMFNASYASNHHESLKSTKLIAHQCMNMQWMMQSVWFHVSYARRNQMHKCICMLWTKIQTPTQIRRQKSIRINEFKNTNPKIRIYIEFACDFSIQFQEKLKIRKQLKISAYLNLTLTFLSFFWFGIWENWSVYGSGKLSKWMCCCDLWRGMGWAWI